MAGIGDNLGIPSRDVILACMADEVVLQGNLQQARDARNMARKGYTGKGIMLGDLDEMIKMSDWPIDDVLKFFARKFAYLGATHSRIADIGDQYDLFNERRPDHELRKTAWEHKGLMAGLKGEKPPQPPGLTADEYSAIERGFDQGQKLLAERGNLLGEAIAAAQAEEAAKAEEKAQREAAKAAKAAAKEAKKKPPAQPPADAKEEPLKLSAGDEGFDEASESELAGQKARTALQERAAFEPPADETPEATKAREAAEEAAARQSLGAPKSTATGPGMLNPTRAAEAARRQAKASTKTVN